MNSLVDNFYNGYYTIKKNINFLKVLIIIEKSDASQVEIRNQINELNKELKKYLN